MVDPSSTTERAAGSNSSAATTDFERLVLDRLDALGTQFTNMRHDFATVNQRLDRLENTRNVPPPRDEAIEDDPPPEDRYHRDVPYRVPPPPVRRGPELVTERRHAPVRDRPPFQRDEYRMPRQPCYDPRDRAPPHDRRDRYRDEYYPPGRRERGPQPARYGAYDDYPEDYPDPQRDDHQFDITRRIRIDAPSFDGRLDPKAFSDWLLDMDHYFEWYDMSDERCVRFAKMKLVGQAKVFWISVERALERDGYYPISSWEEMKDRLREKYLPTSYRDQLFEQLQNLRQGTLTVAEYMARFDELMVRSDISEEPIATASRFRAGLRADIRRELIPHHPESVDQIFQLSLELEQYLRSSGTKQFSTRTDSSTFRKPAPPQTPTAAPSHIPTDARGKAIATDGQQSGGIVCFRCSGRGHVAARCPTRNLLIEGEEQVLDESEDAPEDVRATVEDGWETDAERSLEVGVIRRLLHTPRVDEDWRRTTIFYTYFPSAGGPCKLAIDSGSCVNIVAQKGLDRMQVKAEPHPHPYRVVWVDKTAIQVTQRCLVPITIASFQDKVWCDVIPMDVAHVLLGRPWLFDRDVTCFGRSNTCVFYDRGRKITLAPTQPRERSKGVVEPSMSTST